MEVINSIKDIRSDKPIGLTIGNFDGVHKGHTAFLKKVETECRSSGYLFVVVTFNPHPSFILRNAESFLINSCANLLAKKSSSLISSCFINEAFFNFLFM